MRQLSKRQSWQFRALVFGVVPCVLGLGAVQYLGWSGFVWLSDTGRFWPVTLSLTSAAILVKLCFSAFEEATSSVAAWLTLLATWFYVPAWVLAIEVPYSAAVVSRSGDVHLASGATRHSDFKVWLLSDRSRARIVGNVAGTLRISGLELEYHYAAPYIAGRRNGDDLAVPLVRAATAILGEEAHATRASRIALLEDHTVQDGVLAKLCRSTVGDVAPCPLAMKLSPLREAQALGATWSRFYTEAEAIAERHLPTLVHLLTQSDATLADRDRVFRLVLDLAETVEPLAQVAQRPGRLTDAQFDELIRRILAAPGCGEGVVAIAAKVTRLGPEQRRALREKTITEAAVDRILENAAVLRLSDAEVGRLAPRLRHAFETDPGLAVKALDVFGERLAPDVLRDAEAALLKGRASHALAALKHVNFAPEMRQSLMRKIVSDARVEDFVEARLDKDRLPVVLTPPELRAVAAMAVHRSETSERWLDFTLETLPMRVLTTAERQSLLNGLLFKSPKSALEFVSQNRLYLAPTEVNEVTRDYTRTITGDFCLHLSHRNKNWRMNYFSEDQLQIFRDCADARAPAKPMPKK